MSHYLRSGSAASNRGVARSGGVWEVIGILGAVIPCGILAGLYLATEDILFLLACFGFALGAFGFIFARNLGSLSLQLRRRAGPVDVAASKAVSAGREKLGAVGESFRRRFTIRILKLLGLVLWFVAWAVVVTLHLKIVQNPNIVGIVMLVAIGAFSPIFIYFGLEAGVKKLSTRIRDEQ
jgi:hypothetical protein